MQMTHISITLTLFGCNYNVLKHPNPLPSVSDSPTDLLVKPGDFRRNLKYQTILKCQKDMVLLFLLATSSLTQKPSTSCMCPFLLS